MSHKKDPIFGVDALKKLDEHVMAKVKPLPKLRSGKKKIRLKRTLIYRERQRYLYGMED